MDSVDEGLTDVALGHEEVDGHLGVGLHSGDRFHQEVLGQTLDLLALERPGDLNERDLPGEHSGQLAAVDLGLGQRPAERGVSLVRPVHSHHDPVCHAASGSSTPASAPYAWASSCSRLIPLDSGRIASVRKRPSTHTTPEMTSAPRSPRREASMTGNR